MALIRLEGLSVFGHHGRAPYEKGGGPAARGGSRARAASTTAPRSSDRLADAVDYDQLYRTVREVVGRRELPPARRRSPPRTAETILERFRGAAGHGAHRQAEPGLDHRRAARSSRSSGKASVKAFIGLGSNLGEREAMIRLALDDLARMPQTHLVRASSLYDTEPGRRGRPAQLPERGGADRHRADRAPAALEPAADREAARPRAHAALGAAHHRPRPAALRQPGDRGARPHACRTRSSARRSFVLVPLVELDPLLVHPVDRRDRCSPICRTSNARPPVKRGTRL